MGLVAHEEREHYLEIIRGVIEPLEARAVPIELDPGDVVLFHNLLFHRGLPNRGAAIRWSLDWRYQDAREPTYREQHGHLARSILRPGEVVTSAAQWARLTFVSRTHRRPPPDGPAVPRAEYLTHLVISRHLHGRRLDTCVMEDIATGQPEPKIQESMSLVARRYV